MVGKGDDPFRFGLPGLVSRAEWLLFFRDPVAFLVKGDVWGKANLESLGIVVPGLASG